MISPSENKKLCKELKKRIAKTCNVELLSCLKDDNSRSFVFVIKEAGRPNHLFEFEQFNNFEELLNDAYEHFKSRS